MTSSALHTATDSPLPTQPAPLALPEATELCTHSLPEVCTAAGNLSAAVDVCLWPTPALCTSACPSAKCPCNAWTRFVFRPSCACRAPWVLPGRCSPRHGTPPPAARRLTSPHPACVLVPAMHAMPCLRPCTRTPPPRGSMHPAPHTPCRLQPSAARRRSYARR